MTTIIIDNVYVELQNIDRELELEIWEKLSYEIEEFGSPYVRKKHLYNRKTKKTYTGLLPYVLEILNEHQEEYEIKDTRTKWDSNANFELVKYLDDEKKIKLEPRPYQVDIINNATNREVVQAATGA